MKELKLLTEWADSVINEFDSSNVKTAAKKRNDPIAGEKDIAQQAQTKYAGRDKDQALQLFIADKLEDMEKRDLDQNKVINAQRKENDALRKELTTLAREVHDVADAGQADHREIERIRALAGQAKSDIETRRVGRDELDKMYKEIESMKRSGANPEQIAQIQQQFKELKNHTIPNDKIAEITKQIEEFKQNGGKISDKQMAKLQSELEAVRNSTVSKEKMGEISATIQQLQSGRVTPEAFNALQTQLKDISTKSGLSQEQHDAWQKEIENIRTLSNNQKTELDNTLTKMNKEIAGAEKATQDAINSVGRTMDTRSELDSKLSELKQLMANTEANNKTVKGLIDAGLDAQGLSDTINTVDHWKLGMKVDDGDVLGNALQNLPAQEELAKLKTLPGEIEKQKKINKKQDDEDIKLNQEMRRQSSINDIQNKILNQLSSGKKPEDSTVDTTEPIYQRIDNYVADPLQLPISKDGRVNRKYEIRTQFNSAAPRIENLLARKKEDAKPKSEQQIESDIKKSKIIIGNLINDLQGYLINQYYSIDSSTMPAIMKQAEKYIEPYMRYWSSISGIPIGKHGEKDTLSQYINFDKVYSRIEKNDKLLPDQYLATIRTQKKNLSDRLPESLSTELESLAESILGPQYTKYIK